MDIHNKLKQKGLKATPQRLMILSIIEQEGHIDIEKLYKKISEVIPTISIATIYKNIKILEENGIISEININSFKPLYETNIQKHLHLVCKKCKKIQDISYDEKKIKEALKKSIDENLDFDEFHITFYTICKDCK